MGRGACYVRYGSLKHGNPSAPQSRVKLRAAARDRGPQLPFLHEPQPRPQGLWQDPAQSAMSVEAWRPQLAAPSPTPPLLTCLSETDPEARAEAMNGVSEHLQVEDSKMWEGTGGKGVWGAHAHLRALALGMQQPRQLSV